MLTGADRKQAERQRGTGPLRSAIVDRCADGTGVLMIRQGGGMPAREHAAPSVVDHDVLDRWARTGLQVRREQAMADRPAWVCYESPPLGGGLPGLQHVAARAVADLYLRFMAMQGSHVLRRTLLSCHGLPVEVAVESELGLSGLKDIADYGVARFAARCRESVQRHAEAFAELDARLGCWPASHAATMDTAYTDAVWRSLGEIFDAGLLAHDDRIDPYCPRCQTPLSAQELGQPGVQQTAPGADVIVRFRLTRLAGGADLGSAHPRLLGADLLASVAAPWTLTANAAIAVHPHEKYVIARRAGHDERVIVADARLPQVLGEDWHVAGRITGSDLAGAWYAAPLPAPGSTTERKVVTSYFVNVRTGTGLHPVTPAFAVQDRQAAAAYGLASPDPLGPDGRFPAGTPLVGGLFYTDADRVLAGWLSDRGLVFSRKDHERTRPHCWRCGAPLLFRACPAWHIRVSAIGSRLGAASEQVNWQPTLGGDERLRGWLRGEADWTVSRTRYWGTPLPIWVCEQGHQTLVRSLGELSALEGQDLTGLDLHRPHVDEVTIRCPDCGQDAARVPDVLDVWFDAGTLPRVPTPAQAADLVVEGADHAGAWCFALAATGALTGHRAPFKAAVRTGQVLDSGGRPMSRRSGNLAEPLPLIERHGADAVRWFFALGAPLGAPRTPSDAALAEITSGVLGAYRGAAREFVRCARAAAARGSPWSQGSAHHVPAAARPLPDRWLQNELRGLVRDVTGALAGFEPASAGLRIAAFTELLGRWYLPRSGLIRWQGPTTDAGVSALATLQECLDVLTRLLAPAAPFLADHVWSLLLPWLAGAPDSVHLASWPTPAGDYSEHLAAELSLVRRLGDLGAAARAAADIPASQPLARGRIGFRDGSQLGSALQEEVARTLRVRSLEMIRSDASLPAAAEGPGAAGWAEAAKDGEVVALDLTIGADLAREGQAREVIAAVRQARGPDSDEQATLQATLHTTLWWRTDRADLADALAEHADLVAAELRLASCRPWVADQPPAPGAVEYADRSVGLTVWLDSSG